mgnify:FL=1
MEAGEDFTLFSSVARLGTWLHATVKPVRFNRREAGARGQQGNLSRSLPTKHWNWADLAQRLLEETDDSDAARKERLQQAVAQRWVSAGNHLLRKRFFGLASKAYRRAMVLGQASPGVRARAAVSGLLRPLGKRAPEYERAG